MTAMGQHRWALRASQEVSFIRLKQPLVDDRPAGQWMTCAAAGVVGIKEAVMPTVAPSFVGFAKTPWNKGRLIGQKRPLKPKEVWAIRVRLQLEQSRRDLALFNLAIDSKLRGCDLVRLQINDVCVGTQVRDRATVIQRKTSRPVQFEITEQTRAAIREWLTNNGLRSGQFLFPSRFHNQPHISTRQYARIVHRWAERAGLDSSAYGTHSMRRTKAAQIYRKTGNLRQCSCCSGTRSWKAPSVT